MSPPEPLASAGVATGGGVGEDSAVLLAGAVSGAKALCATAAPDQSPVEAKRRIEAAFMSSLS
jgi:hypothetical protein